jgi:formylglycine-generating enzyme required for sulfatase activity
MHRNILGIIIVAAGMAILMGCSSSSSDSEKSANADLSALSVSAGTLNTAFSAGTTAYTLFLDNAISEVTTTGTKADANATVSAPVTLSALVADAAQTATITVTAQDGTTTKSYTVKATRSMLKTISVPAGSFQRNVVATNISAVSAFRMSEKEITRAQFKAIMGTDPSDTGFSSGTSDPVQMTNWYHAIAFCNKLSLAEGLKPVYSVTGVDFSALSFAAIPVATVAAWDAPTVDWSATGYRLPTDMEWMWAAMGATGGATGYAKAYAGSAEAGGAKVNIGDYAWYDSNSGTKTHPVGTAGTTGHPNELGIYDMSGNVFEWTWDWFDSYPTGSVTDYRGPASSVHRVARGGACDTADSFCSMSTRASCAPSPQSNNYGFRVVRR